MSLAKEFFVADAEEKKVLSFKIHTLIEDISERFYKITEAGTRSDCLNRASRILGTLFLLTPFEDPTAPLVNKKFKVLYRSVTSIRFLDELLFQGKCKSSYMQKYWHGERRFVDTDAGKTYKEMFVKPIVYSIFCELAGFEHPQSLRILQGDKEETLKDEFRVLEPDERDRLKNISLEAGNDLLTAVLQARMETNQFDEKVPGSDIDFASFSRSITNHTYNSNKELGSAFKISQIYTSSIIPSRRKLSRTDSVKTLSYISSHVKKGIIQTSIASRFFAMFGLFPQGFGVTCINEKEKNRGKFAYEMAIVNKLYPDHIVSPHCRVVTRQKGFDRGFSDMTIKKDKNLYFPVTQNSINKKEHEETLKKMLRQGDDLEEMLNMAFPRFWEPNDYYAKRECSLWSNISYEFSDEVAAA